MTESPTNVSFYSVKTNQVLTENNRFERDFTKI